jgi:hypothetical protein
MANESSIACLGQSGARIGAGGPKVGFFMVQFPVRHPALVVARSLIVIFLAAPLGWFATVDVSFGQRARGAAVNHGEQVETINRHVRALWSDYGLRPSAAATDGEWCRRVHLDIIGRIPTVDELQAFLADRSPDKKAKLVHRLLHDERYTEEYARNWTTVWTNTLIGRTGGQENNSLTSREGMQKYLRDSFARDLPYDRLVHDLITATGTTAPGTESFNGAVNFLVMKVNEENATLATAATARIFLGLQVQCTQCHNHPFNDWKQQKFWEMNAFFRQARALRRFQPGTRNIAFAELIDEDFPGEGGDPQEAEIYFELRNAQLEVAYPVFVDGTAIERAGYVSQVNRRRELGKLVLESEYLDQAVVNRYWAHFLGYGFTKPVDDLGPHNTPSHPELLEYLGQALRENSYNLKELIRWITLSDAYGLSSRIHEGNKGDDPAVGELPKFSRFYLRQMRAEELYESLVSATAAHQGRRSYEEQERLKSQWLSQFVQAFGNDEGEESTTFNGSIPQALMMFNGDLIREATSLDSESFLASLVKDQRLTPDKKVHQLFLAALARQATRDELSMAQNLLMARGGNVGAALQDIWWAVLNSNEFILNY